MTQVETKKNDSPCFSLFEIFLESDPRKKQIEYMSWDTSDLIYFCECLTHGACVTMSHVFFIPQLLNYYIEEPIFVL